MSKVDQNDCLRPVLWTNRWILIKLAEILHLDKKNKWINFCDIELIFKVAGDIKKLNSG